MFVAIVSYIFVIIEQKNKPYICLDTIMQSRSQQTIFAKNAKNITKDVIYQISKIEEELSSEIEGSYISRLNDASGQKWIKISPDIMQVAQKILDISQKSMGIFDPTYFSLFKNNNSKVRSMPDENKLKFVDYHDFIIDEQNQRFKLENNNNSASFELVLKGLACQKALEIYKKNNLNCGIVTIGNVIGAFGRKPDNSNWKISIKNPSKNSDNIACLQTHDNIIMASSGDKFEKMQIVNPKTGNIVNKNGFSVSVLCPDGVISCALSTVFFINGIKNSEELIKYYGVDVIVVSGKNIFSTSNLIDKLEINDRSYTKNIIKIGENYEL
ncbi:MAG: thiamine biosynthesis lipoprotein ApbE [Candidatus Improbicoccus devescovinae]|nr:MAG: thiamine biosynthesis lipoprotein ApbE [Candidatus Improbicoccus devescovinae]